MSLYLHKILPIIFLPSGFIIVLILIGLLKRKPILVWLSLILFYLLATPIVSDAIFKYVEKGQFRKDVKSIPKADAIVVLGGMFNYIKTEGGGKNEWMDPDRFFGGIELFKAGKANRLIFTGAKMPWAEKDQETEGEILKKYAIELGVPDSAISISGLVTTTEDESKEVRILMPISKKIILVTSSYHMNRARIIFEDEGFEIVEFSVDFWQQSDVDNFLSFFPRAKSFYYSETAIRELIGRLFYSIF